MNPSELIDRATKAQAVLSSPLYQESYELCRKAILARIEACPMSDITAAEDLRKCLKLLKDVRRNLEAVMSHGKIASFEVAQEEKRKKDAFNTMKGFFR